MSARERLSWEAFWQEHPFDDDARYYRPFAMLAQLLSSGDVKYEDAYRWAKRKADPAGNWSNADMSTFAALGLKPPGK
jgi:hypothetical protein